MLMMPTAAASQLWGEERAVRGSGGLVYEFAPGRPLHLWGPCGARPTLRGAPLQGRAEIEPDDLGCHHTLHPPAGAEGWLSFADNRWRIRWLDPEISALQTQQQSYLRRWATTHGRCWTGADPWLPSTVQLQAWRAWARQVRTQEGEWAARNAWRLAAAQAERVGDLTQQASFLRAAAFASIRVRAFVDAAALLDEAEEIGAPLAEPRWRIYYYRALIAEARGTPENAHNMLNKARVAARAVGALADNEATLDTLSALILLAQGYFSAADQTLANVQQKINNSSDALSRAQTLLNRAWVKINGIGAGQMPPDWDTVAHLLDEATLAQDPNPCEGGAAPDLEMNLLHKKALVAAGRQNWAQVATYLGALEQFQVGAPGTRGLFQRHTYVSRGVELLRAELLLQTGRRGAALRQFLDLTVAAQAHENREFLALAHEGAARSAGPGIVAQNHRRQALEALDAAGRGAPPLADRAHWVAARGALVRRLVATSLADANYPEFLVIFDRALKLRWTRLAAQRPPASPRWAALEAQELQVRTAWEALAWDYDTSSPARQEILAPRWKALKDEQQNLSAARLALWDETAPAEPWLDLAALRRRLGPDGLLVMIAEDQALYLTSDSLNIINPKPHILAQLRARRLYIVPLENATAGAPHRLTLAGVKIPLSWLPYPSLLLRSVDPVGQEGLVLAPSRELEQTGAEALLAPTARRLLHDKATLAGLHALRPDSRWLHFAGHARRAAAWQPYLVMANQAQLGLVDILNQKHPWAWVLLNACGSGRAEATRAGPDLSLAEAYLIAGAKVVIATLDEGIDDKLAYRFAQAWYQAQGPLDPVGAFDEVMQKYPEFLGKYVLWGTP